MKGQLYLIHENSGEEAPLFAWKGFQRVSLAPGALMNVRFTLHQAAVLWTFGIPVEGFKKTGKRIVKLKWNIVI